MKTLTIVRHAKSSWKNTRLRDRDRPLNRRGKQDAPEMGRRIQEAGIRPSLILTSPAVRAVKTARFVADALNYPREFLQKEEALYLASVDRILDILVAQDDRFNNILLVAHNPGLTEFANFLVPGLTFNLPTAGVVSVEIDRDDWSLYGQPRTKLLLHDWPKRKRTRPQRRSAADSGAAGVD